jgi:hypothetical protein
VSNATIEVTQNVVAVEVQENNVVLNITASPVAVEIGSVGPQGPAGPSAAAGDPISVIVRNATGATLPKGTIVYTSGANGTHTQVTPALATSDATSGRTLGWLTESLANNASGLCMVEGYLDGIDTQGIAEGSQLYLSGTTAGGFTATKPQAPIHLVYVGICTKASAGNGRVYVKCQNGYELGEIHDVYLSSPTNNDVLAYDSSTSLWKASKASLRYSHTQTVSLTDWTINHNLGYAPNVTVIDSGGNDVEGSITYDSLNSLTLSFTSAIAGVAYLS